MSRLKLNLAATHPDGAGGLGFLGIAHSFLGIISFAIGMIVSADAAFRIYFEGATLKTFQWVFVSYVAINEMILLSPLLLFTPLLFRTRLEWLRQYDALALRYDRAFHQKWVTPSSAHEEPLLGSADIQSLADLGNSIDRVRAMNAIPFETRLVLQIAVISALPGLPLLFMLMPVMEILQILGGVIL
jgi:pimeloyl-ACP methyl ester carboxylesterase